MSPWERAAIAVTTHRSGPFDTLDAALSTLYPFAARQKRAKLRGIAELVEALDGTITDPETLSEARLLRVAAVLRLGWHEVITAALTEGAQTPAAQWARLKPILEEAETLVVSGRPTTPHRPKRLSTPRAGLIMRRERTRDGYCLHITGRGATDVVVGEVIEQIELMFSPA